MFLNRLIQMSFILIIIAILASCIAKTHTIVTPFDESKFEPYVGDGNSNIQGQAFLKTRGGEVRYAAGNTVTIFPATSYSREIRAAGLRRENLKNLNPRWSDYKRTVVADGSGNFEFKNIPAGDYFIECPIYWKVYGSYTQTTGAHIKKEIKVLPNQTLKVILTQ